MSGQVLPRSSRQPGWKRWPQAERRGRGTAARLLEELVGKEERPTSEVARLSKVGEGEETRRRGRQQIAHTVCSSRGAVRAGQVEVRWTAEVHAGQHTRDILVFATYPQDL